MVKKIGRGRICLSCQKAVYCLNSKSEYNVDVSKVVFQKVEGEKHLLFFLRPSAENALQFIGEMKSGKNLIK